MYLLNKVRHLSSGTLYEIVKYERHPIGEIKRVAERKNWLAIIFFN